MAAPAFKYRCVSSVRTLCGNNLLILDHQGLLLYLVAYVGVRLSDLAIYSFVTCSFDV